MSSLAKVPEFLISIRDFCIFNAAFFFIHPIFLKKIRDPPAYKLQELLIDVFLKKR